MTKKNKKLDFFKQMELENKVLVPKVGKEAEFSQKLAEAHQIGHGALGWQGQAEMMIELGLDQSLEAGGVRFPKNKKKRIDKMRQILIGCFMDDIHKYGEWVTKEEAKQRAEMTDILYKDLDACLKTTGEENSTKNE